jgi:hypothetical protein
MSKAFSTQVDKEINHDGFKVTFSNGCTISVIFGKYTFSDGGETTAEVAAWNNVSGKWMIFQGDRLPFDQWIELDNDTEVMSRQTAEEVANLIYTLSKYSTEE